MKKIITMIAMAIAFAIPLSTQAQYHVTKTVGEGTGTSGNVPIYFYYNYSFSQVIYLAEELTPGTITSISYYFNSSSSIESNSTIYMGETSLSDFGSSYTVTNLVNESQMEEVFSGSVTYGEGDMAGWVTIELDTPFEYTGSGNLVVSYFSAQDYGTRYFKATNTPNKKMAAYKYTDSSPYTTTPTSASPVASRPDTKFEIIPADQVTSLKMIGDEESTTKNKLPVEFYYEDSYSQVIYTASEVGAGLISAISYNLAATGGGYSSTPIESISDTLSIWLGETEATSFASTSSILSGSELTQVFSGILTYTPGWVTINFDTPYLYTGEKNLVVGYISNRDAYNADKPQFIAHTTTGNMSFLSYKDGYDYSVDGQLPSGYNNNVLNYRPNTKFKTTAYETTVYGTACSGQAYSDEYFTLTAADVQAIAEGGGAPFFVRLKEEAGMTFPEVVTLQLTVTPPQIDDRGEFDICYGADYTVYPFNITNVTTDGTHSVTTIGEDGCSILHTVKLVVRPVEYISREAEVCFGGTFTDDEYYYWYDPHFNITYSANGYSSSQAGENAILVGTYDAAGENTYVWRGVSTYGCAITDSLTLTVAEPVAEPNQLSGTICFGESFIDEEGLFTITYSDDEDAKYTYQEAGVHQYVAYVPIEGGCMKAVTLNLTVNPAESIVLDRAICMGGNYNDEYFNISYNEDYGYAYEQWWYTEPVYGIYSKYDGNLLTYTWNGYTENGCTKTVTLNLTINPADVVDIYDVVCEGEDYTKNGFNIQDVPVNAPVYTLSYTSQEGCISEMKLHLTVNPIIPFNENAPIELCEGNDYTYVDEANEFEYTFANLQANETYRDVVYSDEENGCRKVRVFFDVNTEEHPTFEESFCFNETHRFVNEYFDVRYSENGYSASQEDEDSKVIGTYGEASTEPYVYTWEGFTSDGCPKTATLTLRANPVYAVTLEDFACQGSNYTKNGFNIPNVQEDGTHTLLLRTAAGCDSIVTLNLTVGNTEQIYFADYVCFGGTYAFSEGDINFEISYADTVGFRQEGNLVIGTYDTLSESNDNYYFMYTWEGTTEDGCTITVDLYLDVYKEYGGYWEEICFGESYLGNGFEITYSEDYDEEDSQGSRDSDVVIGEYGNLTAEDDGHIYTYYRDYVDENGCIRTDELYLVVNKYDTIRINETICLGATYNDNDFYIAYADTEEYSSGWGTYTEPGTYEFIIEPTGSNGCDRKLLTLTVNPMIEINYAATVCQGNDYVANGFELYDVQESGIHRVSVTMGECLAEAVLDLTVVPVENNVFVETIHFRDAYNANGFNIALSANVNEEDITNNVVTGEGTYVETGEFVFAREYDRGAGCIEYDTLVLTVIPALDDVVVIDTICEGSEYVENGFNITYSETAGEYIYTQPGTFTYTRKEVIDGSGLTTILNLTVKPSYMNTINAEICQGSDYIANGFTLYNVQESGVHKLNLRTVEGCDSITTLNLTVKPIYANTIAATICKGSDYVANGFNFTDVQESGIHTLNYLAVNGCDSVVTLNLTVVEQFVTDVYATVCQGAGYVDGNFNLTAEQTQESAVHTLTLTSVSGCDSVLTLYLTISNLLTNDIYATVCQGSDYLENGFEVYNAQEDGVYTYTSTPEEGCDVVNTLYLTVNPVVVENLEAAVCQGSDYVENGFNLTNVQESGVHTLNLQTEQGCAKTVNLTLTVLPTFETALEATVCQGSDYTASGFNIINAQESGVYTQYLTSANGCDSTVTLTLTVNPVENENLTVTVCQGGDYTENGFELYNVQTSGVHTMNVQTANGCTKVVTLNLTVLPAQTSTITATVCQGSDYTENGFNILNAQESGVYTLETETANGCTSVVTLYLTVRPTYSINFAATVCQGSDYVENGFNLTNVQESGVHTLNLQSVNGCDSTVTLTLTVNPVENENVTATVCQGGDYTENGFELYNVQESGIHTINVQTANGCVKTVTLNLTVVPAYTINLSATICQGGNYTDNGFNLTNVQESGVHTLNLTTANGCDSIVTLNLNVLLAYSINIEATVNQGENYTANGFNITNVQENGVYTQTLTAANGCDSVIVLNLTVNVGLEDAVSAEALSAILYPNPAENFTTLKIENLTSEAEVIVFDIQGRAIIRQTVQAGESEIRFDLTNVEAGTYSVRIMTKEGMTTRKLIRR